MRKIQECKYGSNPSLKRNNQQNTVIALIPQLEVFLTTTELISSRMKGAKTIPTDLHIIS